MSGFSCPNCGHITSIFGQEGAAKIAMEMDLEVLGTIPLHPSICAMSDSGTPVVVAEPESPLVRSNNDIHCILSITIIKK